MSVQDELLALTKLKTKAGETAEAFTTRVLRRVNTMADASEENWRALSEEAQAWVNANVVAQENGQPLTLLDVKAESEEVSETTEEEETKVVATTKAKVPAKAPKAKAPAPAKAAKVKAAAPKAAAKAVENGKAAENGSRGRPSRIDLKARVRKLILENPHRKGTKSYDYYKVYRDGMTLDQVLKKGVPRAEVNWHIDRGIVSFE